MREITGAGAGAALLNEALYSYRHICRQKLSEDEPQHCQRQRNWFIVGSLTGDETQSQMSPFNHVPIDQSLVQFTFLNKKEVKFLLRSTDIEIKITLQSLQQCHAFYALIYHNVKLDRAVSVVLLMLTTYRQSLQTLLIDSTIGFKQDWRAS